MKIYLVGGAVRDRLLGLPVDERDWLVVGATEQEMLDAGYRRADADFPVFLHPETGEEYALARTETKIAGGYKGFTVDACSTITLEQDLARRDLTINALVEDESGQLIDHYQGQRDLDARQLRHITPAFVEDPVRILRIARFAAHLGSLGFEVAPETQALMAQMVQSGELQNLKPERIWKEMRKALLEPQPWQFFEVLLQCGALALLIPELTATTKSSTPFGSLRKITELSNTLAVRFTAALYPAAKTVDSITTFCNRLRADKACCDLLEMVIHLESSFAGAVDAKAEALLIFLEKSKAQQQPERFQDLLLACEVLWPDLAKMAIPRLKHALIAINDITAKELISEGYQGSELGAALRQQRIKAIEQRVMSNSHD